jgi:type II secretory pathway pseudopilin PulG
MRARGSGFTIVEVVLALSIMAVGVIAAAPMFVLAARENAAGGDLGEVGALAVEQLEDLRGQQWYVLQNGGSLQTSVSGFSDHSDPDFEVRWLIADSPNPPAGMKLILVRAAATRQVLGRPKEVTLATLRGE